MNLRRLLTGTGRRRAVDYIPVVEAERDQARAEAAALTERLGHADDLLAHLCCVNARLERERDQARADVALMVEAHQYLVEEADEQAHRIVELRAELANLRPVSCPAPADWPDSEADTQQMPVLPLWAALSTTAA